MKVVHELYVRCQVGGGALRPYAQAIHEAGKLPVSGYVDELMIVSPASPPHDEDVVYIDGDLRVVHRALTDALHVLELVAKDAVERGTLDPEWRTKP